MKYRSSQGSGLSLGVSHELKRLLEFCGTRVSYQRMLENHSSGVFSNRQSLQTAKLGVQTFCLFVCLFFLQKAHYEMISLPKHDYF